jgi:hypothetical protein
MAAYEDHLTAFFRDHPEWDTPENREIVGEVNRRIDQFAHYPREDTVPRHRRFLHHAEGIDYFGRIYGEVGYRAAEHHVLLDCGHVPHAIDYYSGAVDEFGSPKTRHHP